MDRLAKLTPSNNVRIWMPIFIGDYLSDTIGMTNAQHGAYFLAMMAYWRKGESLTTRELRSATRKEFTRVSLFFSQVDDLWHHKRLDIELAKARDNNQRMRDIAAKSVSKRRATGQLPKSNVAFNVR